MEHWLWNEHYPNDEAFIFALADVLHEEYKQITDAGVILQVDDPDLPDGWQMFPTCPSPTTASTPSCGSRRSTTRCGASPRARPAAHLLGQPARPARRRHPARDFIDLVLSVKAECYSIEAANPRHEHEWTLCEDVRLPDGKSLMPGVVGHATDIIEHPELVAQRIIRYAKLVGAENVIAGTDCGLGSRVGHPEIVWAKLEELAEGARIASRALFRNSR